MQVEKRHRNWLLAGGFLLFCGFGALVAQLVTLQVARHEELAGKARKFWERTYVKASRRGDIRDGRGTLLATSKPVKTVCADPSVVGTNYVQVARALAPLLEMPANELIEKLQPRFITNKAGKLVEDKYVVLKRKVEIDRWQQITNAMANLQFVADEKALPRKTREYFQRVRMRSLTTEQDEVRVYPNGSLAAHVIGYAGMFTEETASGPTLVTKGADGMELMLNSVLNGVNGWVQTEMDSARREVVVRRDQNVAAREGLDAYLTIDAGLQHIVEVALADAFAKHEPLSVSAAVIRPRTGEVLAMANLPTFDPNAPGAVPPENRRNHFVADMWEPGSTFKTAVISGALNEKLVNLQTMINCENGAFWYNGRLLHDDGNHKFGVITVEHVLSHSSNIGAAKIGIQMGPDRLYSYIKAFGFGNKTGIMLPAESPGLVYAPKNWDSLSISRIPMGHGVASTPLQTLMAICAIANDGLLMKPMILSRLVDRNGNTVLRTEPQPVRQVISPAAAREMIQALKTVVSTNGTGAKAAMPFYTVAGKTGTAQKAVNGVYPPGKYFSSFVGFFPADNPELCISVVFDEPKHGHYGADTAVPVFRTIAEGAARYLAIPVERTGKETLATR
jgi:cell division protein FtsI/penicillin-binding protein 2